MNKILEIERCCDCPFNELGQEIRIPLMETYLGKTIQKHFGTEFGGPLLYCMYNPGKSLRDNVKGGAWNKRLFYIWISGNESLKDEFDKQLGGFPKRCPLLDKKYGIVYDVR